MSASDRSAPSSESLISPPSIRSRATPSSPCSPPSGEPEGPCVQHYTGGHDRKRTEIAEARLRQRCAISRAAVNTQEARHCHNRADQGEEQPSVQQQQGADQLLPGRRGIVVTWSRPGRPGDLSSTC